MSNKLETWQIWHAMRKTLGDSFVMTILGRRNARTIRMYAQDPRFTGERSKDPIEALAILFNELDTYGRRDIAELAITHLQVAIGHSSSPHSPNTLKETIDAELLADYQAVADLQSAINDKLDQEDVKKAMHSAVQEIERTYAKYCQEQN